MLTPQQFADKVGLSYSQVLIMCKKKEIDAIVTNGSHYKIPEKELDKYIKNDSYVTKEEYLKVVRENEELRTIIKNCIKLLDSSFKNVIESKDNAI